MSESCIFCRILAGKIPAREAARGDDWLAIHDLHPQAPTHLLFVPRRHVASLDALEAADAALAGRLILAAAETARTLGLAAKGYRLVWNCGADGGQTVFHLHLHLLGGRSMGWPPG